jgi:hypothetical protein
MVKIETLIKTLAGRTSQPPRVPQMFLAAILRMVLPAVLPALLLVPSLLAQDAPPGQGAGALPSTNAEPVDTDAVGGVLEAAPLSAEIRVDGALDEPAWAAAPTAEGFRQQEPDEGAPATFGTRVHVLFSEERLYIGARMGDPEPERLIARVLERDGLIEQGFFSLGSGDDAFFVVLDTYDDGRNGFLFATNPNGAETDALLRGEGDLNVSWDAVWSVATAVDSAGWTAEIEIPFWALRFAKSDPQRWGINFERVIKRRNEVVLWRSWTRDNGGLLKVSQAGTLLGLAGLEQGLNLQLKPYLLAEGSREILPARDPPAGDGEAENEAALDAGLDAKFGVTPNVILDATLNTDFAQVEADIRQINLTRFSLFFPEKREFFLEGAGIFDFGVPGFGGPPSLLVFFSRRIGLVGGVEVPILGGAKLTGKEGRWTLGFLDVVTDESEVSPTANFGVGRVLYDVGSRSSVGAIATHRAGAGGAGAGAVGVDAHLQMSQKMAFDAFAAGTDAPGSRGETAAYRTALDFTADQWGWFLQQMYVGAGFEPPVGFVLRDDVNRQLATFRVTPRPAALGLRRVDLRLFAEIFSSGGWRIRDRDYRFSVTPQFDSGDGFELAVSDNFQRLVEPFVLSEAVFFPAGDYSNTSYGTSVFTSGNRPVSGRLYANRFGFFSGRNVNLGAGVTLAASRNLSVEASWDHNDIESPDGDLTTDLATLRVNYAFSTRLFTNALLQYDSVADELEANVRLNLIHSAGSDLFIVLNERRGEPGDLFEAKNRALVVKFTKLFNF